MRLQNMFLLGESQCSAVGLIFAVSGLVILTKLYGNKSSLLTRFGRFGISFGRILGDCWRIWGMIFGGFLAALQKVLNIVFGGLGG